MQLEPMANKLQLALPGLCAILALLVLAEIIVTTPASTKASAQIAGIRYNGGEAAGEKADQIMAEILKRPLFTQGRQPPEDKVVKAEPPQLQGRLSGVMIRQDIREALFTRPGGKPIAVKTGQVIDGWTLSRIESEQVVLTSEFGEKIVGITNGSPDEASVPHRVVKKNSPTQNKPAGPTKHDGQPQKAAQLGQVVASAGSTGQK